MVNENNSDSELKDSNSQRAITTPYPPHTARRSLLLLQLECAMFRPIAI
jgi:hypothetical protein